MILLTLETLEGLKHLNELDGAENIRVLGGNLDDDLQVLADVDTEHFLHTSERLLSGELAEVVHEPLHNGVSV